MLESEKINYVISELKGIKKNVKKMERKLKFKENIVINTMEVKQWK